MIRRRLAQLLALAVSLFALVPVGAVNMPVGGSNPACPTPAEVVYDCTNFQIPVNTDQALIDATYYWPKTANANNRVPAMLMTHGYGGWHRSAGDIGHATMFASNGYAVLSYTSRGFGRSEGEVRLQDPNFEVVDAQNLITWLSARDEVMLDGPGDPRVGMSGVSYAGGIQLLTAAYENPKRLDALAPQITWNDLRYSLSPNGVTHHGWIDLLYASGKFAGYFGPIGAPIVVSSEGVPADQDVQVLSSYLTNENIENPAGYSDGTSNSYDYLARRSVGPNSLASQITAPTLLLQGQRDTLFTANEAMRSFASISAGANKKLLVFSSGHGVSDLREAGQLATETARERQNVNSRILAWMDHYLKPATKPTIPPGGPSIETWRPWLPYDGSNFAAPGVPLGNSLIDFSSAGTRMVANAVAPSSHSETTNFQGTTNSPSRDAAQGVTSLDYSAPISQDTYLFGAPQLNFTISSAAPEAIIFAKLWDQDSTGQRTLIHNLVSPARIRGGVGNLCSQHLPGSLVPGAQVGTVNVCLEMSAISWKLELGHNLTLTLATSNSTHFGSRYPGVHEISGVSLTIPRVGAF